MLISHKFANDADWVGCSITLAGSNFDTSWFAAAIELDEMVQEHFSFGDSRELFNPCKAKDNVIENTIIEKYIFQVQYFRNTQVITEIHEDIVSQIFGAIPYIASCNLHQFKSIDKDHF